ncbi:unnamed protein product [Acanthoscelides obtectus]|uniref:Uncharacterized protein n=1 Tax=Acanthoscelides obtectus TaxID=200917 RepID=A0A9P0PQD3_ACAOB|nr:unnamed protein product [Acanthoscelides obtectus]CAK1630885.1 hypothetical protein AOBTE_LOCUS6615 [Acanthoscelides obtectus]
MTPSFVLFGIICTVSAIPIDPQSQTYVQLLQESENVQNQMKESTSTVLQNIASYDTYIKNMSDSILAEQLQSIHEKISGMKANLGKRIQKRSAGSSENTKDFLTKCVINEDVLDRLADEVNEQIKTCSTVAMAEMSNVISSSMADAQAFMTLPNVIGSDVQRCGLNKECRWDIVQHSILEALQVPPKIYSLTAKIQSLVLKTVISIDSCGLKGLRNIGEVGVQLMQDVYNCIMDEVEMAN